MTGQPAEEMLEQVSFDMGATRPELLLGLPYTLAVTLSLSGVLFVMFYSSGNQISDLVADAIALGAVAIVWSTARVMLSSDYHGWGNFLAWCRLDATCLDTKEWGGARLASFPLRSKYRCGGYDA